MKEILREQTSYPRIVYIALIGALIIASLVAYRIYSIEPSKNNPFSPAPSVVQESVNPEKYPLHQDITATVFWAGEQADSSNDFITNTQSYWTEDWTKAFGGVDDPNDRCGFNPCGFTPQENPFYFALPFGDRDSQGNPKPESDLERIPWYEGGIEKGESILKNRWLQISHQDKVAYAQWEDVGPFGEDDIDYVFGNAEPRESRAGLDLSPATAQFLGIEGRGQVDWRFVDDNSVPEGPWKEIVTTSKPDTGS